MSRFSTQLPGSIRRRGGARTTPTRLGIVATPSVPGQAITPPVSGTSSAAQDLLRVLGQAGGVASSVANIAGSQARRIERNNRAARAENSGLGADAANSVNQSMTDEQQVALFEDFQDVVNDQEDIGEQIRAFAQGVVSDEIAALDNQTESFGDSYRRRREAAIVTSLTASQDALDAFNRTDTLALMATGDMADGNAVAAAVAQGLVRNERQGKEAILLPRLNTAALMGDEDRFSQVAAQLGPRGFEAEIATARVRLDTNINRQQAEQQDASRQMVFGALNDAILGGGSYDTARRLVREMRASGELTEQQVTSLNVTIDERERAELARVNRGLRTSALQSLAQDVFDASLDINSPPLTTYTDQDYGDFTFSSEEWQAAVTSLAMETFERDSPSPDVALNRMVTWLSRHGINQVPELSDAMNDWVNYAQGNPAAAVNAFEAWRTIRSKNAQLANELLNDDTLRLNRLALFRIERTQGAGADPGAALAQIAGIQAARTSGELPTPRELPTAEQIRKKLPGKMRTALNSEQIAATARADAEMMVQIDGVDSREAVGAVAAFIADDMEVLDKWASPARRLTTEVRGSLQLIRNAIVDAYVEENPETEAKNLSIRSQNGMTWHLIDKRTGQLIDSDRMWDAGGLEETLTQIRMSKEVGVEDNLFFVTTQPTGIPRAVGIAGGTRMGVAINPQVVENLKIKARTMGTPEAIAGGLAADIVPTPDELDQVTRIFRRTAVDAILRMLPR